MRKLLSAAILAVAGTSATANDFEPQIRAYLANEILGWASERILIDAVMDQNLRTVGLSDDEILDLDMVWRSEVGAANQPTITPVLSSTAAAYLRSRVSESSGAISEVFIMDMRGLNVAASGVTSDYWQGDEGKFENSFLAGTGAVFIDDVEFDESTQSYLAQVSITLSNPLNGEAIGAMTIGLNAESLF